MLTFTTAGESHGKAVLVIIEGMPSNVPISSEALQEYMKKRMKGSGAGGRMLIETDTVEIISGIRFGKTIGSPITLLIENKDYKNWGEKMSHLTMPEEVIDSARVTNPRPGHVDLPGVQKYNFSDIRNVLERASARETTARVAAGAVFTQFLKMFDIEIASHTLQIGSVKLERSNYTFKEIATSYSNDPEIRCIDPETSARMKEAIATARKEMNTLGGVVEIWAVNVPVGLGSYVHYERKIDGQLAQALMSIQSVKAVEIGEGVRAAGIPGSEVHDQIYHSSDSGFYRKTNRAGGVEGGVTNGMPLIARVYHKPISTLYKPMDSVHIDTKAVEKATVERSDICIVPRGAVVSESMVAFVIARNMLEMFGNGSLEDMQTNYSAYLKRIKNS